MSRGLPAWAVRAAACPGCSGALSAPSDALVDGLLTCRGCEALYPVLGGVAILVADPADYLASYRDSVLATLAEHRLASRAAVELVAGFADAARGAEPLRFSDDTVAADLGPTPTPLAGEGAAARFRDFLAAVDAAPSPDDLALELAPARLRLAVEVGCGAGALTGRLRARAERLWVIDLSLRAVLGARAAARRRRGGELAAAVAAAEALPLRAGKASALFAVNLVDLLADPGAFFSGAAAALARGGRLVLTTPDPALGGGGDQQLDAELERAGLRAVAERDAVPWLRRHSPRHVEVYFARAVAAARS